MMSLSRLDCPLSLKTPNMGASTPVRAQRYKRGLKVIRSIIVKSQSEAAEVRRYPTHARQA